MTDQELQQLEKKIKELEPATKVGPTISRNLMSATLEQMKAVYDKEMYARNSQGVKQSIVSEATSAVETEKEKSKSTVWVLVGVVVLAISVIAYFLIRKK